MSTVTVPVWQLVLAVAGYSMFFLSIIAFLGKGMVKQFKDHVDARFKTMEEARVQSQSHWDHRFNEIDEAGRRTERELLDLKAKLPVEYQRREDAIRQEVGIIARLDALANWIRGSK